MAIRGSLSEASLADVLQLLALGQKSGVLSVARDGSLGSVHFQRGAVVYATIVNRLERLGDRLLRRGVLAADALVRLQAAIPADDDLALARALLNEGHEAGEVIRQELRALVEEAIYHQFAWESGTFAFEPSTNDPNAPEAVVTIAADALLMEAARRVDEWAQIEKKIPTLDLIFEVDAGRLTDRAVGLAPEQERILPWLDGTHDVTTIIERSGLGEFAVGKALYGLVTAGYVQRVGRSSARRPAPPESRLLEHRNLGIAFYRTGMYDEALREFRRVLELREDDAAARFHLGLVLLQRGEWEPAVETFRLASSHGHAAPAVWHNLAFALEQLGQLDEAEAALAQAARSGGASDPRVVLSQAVIALRRGDHARAEERLTTARSLWGARQPSAVWFHIAGLSAALGADLAGAAAVLEEGLALYPQSAILHNNYAVVQERRGRHEAAARTLEHALLADSALPHLHKNLGDYLYRAQRYDDAHDAYARVVRLSPAHGADVWLKLGNIHYRRGAVDDARSAWERALVIDPANAIVRANLAAAPGIEAKNDADRLEPV